MRVLFNKYPFDIILFMLWSLILLPLALLDVTGLIRIIFGLPFILFIPGYVLIFLLFPKRKIGKGIDVLERIALSFGFSMAIVALILFLLNYTSGGIRLESVLVSIFIFVIGIGYVAMIRWFKTDIHERFILSINFSKLKSNSNFDKFLTIIIVISILIVTIFFIYTIINPRKGEIFTAFYIFDSNGGVSNYPSTLAVGENANVKIGLVNHEYQTMDYVIEVWLIDQSFVNNKTIYNHMWFMDKINITLPHVPGNIEKSWSLQWQYNYIFNISKKGEDFELAFLLFTNSTDEYKYNVDYSNIAEQKINNAYRKSHIWFDVE